MSSIVENLRVDEAIKVSEQQNRIVRLRYSEFRHSQLFLASDGCVMDKNMPEHEYWTDTWRIHLVK